MKPDMPELTAHRDAVLSLRVDLDNRAMALESAAVRLATNDKSPTKALTMQALGRLQNKVNEACSAASVYSRMVDNYIAECEKKG
jgi:hypothetical protein